MLRFSGLVCLTLLAGLFSGCAMCCTPYDDHYLYQGGKWQRTIPNAGRVGSAFDPAGDTVTSTSPATNMNGAPPATVNEEGAVIMEEGGEFEIPTAPAISQRMSRPAGNGPRAVSRARY